MTDIVTLNGGLFIVNVLISIHILLMVLIIVRLMTKGRASSSHISAAKTTFTLFAVLGVWTVFGKYFMDLDGDVTETVITFVALSLRVAIAIIVTAWAWDVLEGGHTTREGS